MPRLFSSADLYGAARLGTDAVVGVTDLAEAVHAAISRPLGQTHRTRGITGVVYRSIRTVTTWVGRGLAAASGHGRTAQTLSGLNLPAPEEPIRETMGAILNGVLGDTLHAQDNPLATTMQIRYGGSPLRLDGAALRRAVPEPRETLLVRVHGICMHDGQWGAAGSDDPLAETLGATPLSLRYNSGRHISESGREFADLIDVLVTMWPRPVRRLVIVGHSMGGLVARSAFHYGTVAGHAWPALDAALVTLGSPHHGAPLERLGNLVDSFLGATRYTAPFARIGQIRSAGVTDLRFGNLLDEDWAGRDRFVRAEDPRQLLPLPRGVACYLVGATTGEGTGGWRDQSVGDGLVPLDSALGRHPDPARCLDVPADRTWVAAGMTHFELLRRPEVTAQLVSWLAPRAT